jgi:MoaA/NifB/PqqE/SkfB family radical SAM enzyme
MQAAPFCFGPVSTSLAIAEELRRHDVAIVWLAEGTALELLREGNHGDYIVPFRLANPEDRRIRSHIVEEADLVVVNTDPDFAEFAVGLNKEVLYVDILYWMWHELPSVVSRCSLYIYEDFVRSAEQVRRLGLPPRSLRVGPLTGSTIGEPPGAVRENHLLVSLGGLHRPGGAASALLRSYERMVREALVDALDGVDAFKTVYFAGGGLERSETKLSNGSLLRSGCLSRTDHQRLLTTARATVMAPGLTGFYEAATAGVPVFFLPPHNYSQHLQLQSYKAVLPEQFFCDWQRLGIATEMACFLPEEEMLQQVDAILAGVVEKRDQLTRDLREFLQSGWRCFDSGPLVKMVEELRSASTGGAERVAAEIVQRIETRIGRSVGSSGRARLDAVPLPKKVMLELFGGCQLRCPLCPTGNRMRPGRAPGAMTLATARAILDQIAGHVDVIDLFNWGEPFLNLDACAIIRMISDRGIRTVISSNLQVIPDPNELIASGLSELIVSCHGMTQEVYAKYMVGGDVEKTLRNLDSILAAGGPSMAMKIVLRFVVFAHNEHELCLAQERFRDTPVTVEAAPMRIDMRDEILKPASENLQIYGEWVPESSRFYNKQNGEAPRSPLGCNLPFEETVIDVDGSISLCCSSFDPEFNLGNILTEGFMGVWNGPRYREAREVVTGASESRASAILCRTCKNNGYRDF